MQAIPIPRANGPERALTLADTGRRRYQFRLARPGEVLYLQACDLSASVYREHFQCELKHFYPRYLCLERNGRLLAVCGYRGASEPLFLEQYLDQPVDQLLRAATDEPVARSQIVEIGGFALQHQALALPFMAALAPMLQQLGFSHAVATATLPVRRCLRRLGISTTHLGRADETRLADDGTSWGSYYRQRPAVIAAPIAGALEQLQENASR